MLECWLDYHRAPLLARCAGLDDEQHADLVRELIDGTVSS